MDTVTRKAKELEERLVNEAGIDELNELTRPFRLSDAIREGSTVSGQAYGWQDGDNACALSAAAISLTARGYGE